MEMVHAGTFNTRGLRLWGNGRSIRAMPGDKVIIFNGNRVLSGVLMEVGTKYVYLRYTPYYHDKRRMSWKSHKVAIELIERLAVFPRDFKDYGHVYNNGKERSYKYGN